MDSMLLLAGAGFTGGAMNALAGGGSFVTLPALIAAGVPSVPANASSTVALYPGGVASVWVYRDGIKNVPRPLLIPCLWATLVGGALGALLLLSTPTTVFDRVLPWLLLVATIMLIFGRRISVSTGAREHASLPTMIGVQFVLGIYGGYFGGAVGLMMLATWSVLAGMSVKMFNPSRTLLTTAANTIAVLCFAVAHAIYWREAVILGAGALAGGYTGAHIGRRLPPSAVYIATVAVACSMTVAFFVRAYK
jgi:uncharacterized membrane protein YfcA